MRHTLQRALALVFALVLLMTSFAGIAIAVPAEPKPIPVNGRMIGIGEDAIRWIRIGASKAPTKIKKISITKPKKALRVGEKPKLTVKITYSGKKPAMSRFVAEYTNPEILSVAYEKKAFYVEPLALGNTTLTIKDALGTKEGSALLTVSAYAPQSVTLDQTTLTLQKGQSYQLEGSVLPESANQKLTWKSSKTSVAKVSKIGLVKAIKKGKATITATSDNGKKTTCVVTIVTTPAPTPTPPPPTGSRRVKKIAAGDYASFALMDDGALYAWGSNDYGQLGDGTTSNKQVPTRIGGGFTDIAVTSWYALALKGEDLYTWGRNYDGELAIDTAEPSKNMPVKVGSGYTAIAAGEEHLLALKGTDLYAWGNNGQGLLGDGTDDAKRVPTKIGSGFTAIAAGRNHSLALKGTDLYAWGNNYRGQLGGGTEDGMSVPTKIGSGFTAIVAGTESSLALKGTDLYAWGGNTFGQLGDGRYGYDVSAPKRIGSGYTAIAVGEFHSLALKGTDLYAWGSNGEGQLGDGTKGDGSKVGYNGADMLTPMLIGSGYTSISGGGYHTLALKGEILHAWGLNSRGQLGLGDTASRLVPTRITYFD